MHRTTLSTVERIQSTLMSALLKPLLALALLLHTALSLEIHFYRTSCPQAELVVNSIVKQHFEKDPSVPAGLLRLHFHDCIIRVRFLQIVAVSIFFQVNFSCIFPQCYSLICARYRLILLLVLLVPVFLFYF